VTSSPPGGKDRQKIQLVQERAVVDWGAEKKGGDERSGRRKNSKAVRTQGAQTA